MKKILLGVVFMLVLFQSKAQNLSVNYTYNFLSNSEYKFKENKLIPKTGSQFSVAYSQSLRKLPIAINVSAAASRKHPPPKLILLPNPPPIDPTIGYRLTFDSVGSGNPNTTSFDLMLGAGFILPHKANSKLVIIANADFGVSFNNNQTLKFYKQRDLIYSVDVVKTQLIINPNIKVKYSLTNALGIGVGVGYSNIGGVNAMTSIIINPFRRKDGCSHWQCCGVCDWFPRKKGD